MYRNYMPEGKDVQEKIKQKLIEKIGKVEANGSLNSQVSFGMVHNKNAQVLAVVENKKEAEQIDSKKEGNGSFSGFNFKM